MNEREPGVSPARAQVHASIPILLIGVEGASDNPNLSAMTPSYGGLRCRTSRVISDQYPCQNRAFWGTLVVDRAPLSSSVYYIRRLSGGDLIRQSSPIMEQEIGQLWTSGFLSSASRMSTVWD